MECRRHLSGGLSGPHPALLRKRGRAFAESRFRQWRLRRWGSGINSLPLRGSASFGTLTLVEGAVEVIALFVDRASGRGGGSGLGFALGGGSLERRRGLDRRRVRSRNGSSGRRGH